MEKYLADLRQIRSMLIIEAKQGMKRGHCRKQWEQTILLLNKVITILENISDT